MIDTSPTPWTFEYFEDAVSDAKGEPLFFIDTVQGINKAPIRRAVHAVNHHAALRDALAMATCLLTRIGSATPHELGILTKALAESAEVKP